MGRSQPTPMSKGVGVEDPVDACQNPISVCHWLCQCRRAEDGDDHCLIVKRSTGRASGTLLVVAEGCAKELSVGPRMV